MLNRVHVLPILFGLLSVAMLVPVLQAATGGEWRSARGFLYPSIFGMFAAAALGVLLKPFGGRETAQQELLVLLAAWITMPMIAAAPLALLTPEIGVVDAWFEMVAALTTTGGSVYRKASAVPDAIHLWRGIVGWLGGLMTLMAAYVILAPRRMGGYEILAAADGLSDTRAVDLRAARATLQSRTERALRAILPVYAAVTGVLAIALSALGKPGLVASVHAMSVMSTSGITPVEGGFGSFWAEAFALVCMVLAVTRLVYAPALRGGTRRRAAWRSDPELRLMLGLVVLAALAIYARHWVVAAQDDTAFPVWDRLAALWGAIFNAVSFLTTTGFTSFAWEKATAWAGLENPGLVLLCLCAIGGGAATTAGGIKLIRAWALLHHGVRELERIAAPLSVAGSGNARGLRREGAIIAWAFMMLFFAALLVTLLALTLSGMGFSDALIAAIAALSNTGPAFALVAEQPSGFAILDAVQHVILACAMVLGRIETLAVIALFNAELWHGERRPGKRTGKSSSERPL